MCSNTQCKIPEEFWLSVVFEGMFLFTSQCRFKSAETAMLCLGRHTNAAHHAIIVCQLMSKTLWLCAIVLIEEVPS